MNSVVVSDLIEGPAVQMNLPAKPKSIIINRDSKKNGVVTDWEFAVVPTNFMSHGDKIAIKLPHPCKLSETSKCVGISDNLESDLESKVSIGLKSIEITLSVKGRRLAGKIASNTQFKFKVTDIHNPDSF